MEAAMEAPGRAAGAGAPRTGLQMLRARRATHARTRAPGPGARWPLPPPPPCGAPCALARPGAVGCALGARGGGGGATAAAPPTPHPGLVVHQHPPRHPRGHQQHPHLPGPAAADAGLQQRQKQRQQQQQQQQQQQRRRQQQQQEQRQQQQACGLEPSAPLQQQQPAAAAAPAGLAAPRLALLGLALGTQLAAWAAHPDSAVAAETLSSSLVDVFERFLVGAGREGLRVEWGRGRSGVGGG
jgi:hypothetical protein